MKPIMIYDLRFTICDWTPALRWIKSATVECPTRFKASPSPIGWERAGLRADLQSEIGNHQS